MQIVDRPSPNFGQRKNGATPDMIILHYTGMETAEAALDRLCDPGPEVSAHYLICERGLIYRLVAETARAWHAGQSYWQGDRDINSRSIGIELANPGPLEGYPPFPAAQMTALEDLIAEIRTRWPVEGRVLGHSDVAPGRKVDPGPKFDWRRVAGDDGLAFAHEGKAPDDAALVRFGYDPDVSADARLAAFRLRFGQGSCRN